MRRKPSAEPLPAQPPVVLNSDNPITTRAADRLRRTAFADVLARQVQIAPVGSEDGGFAIGLVGAWGSGKTSLINMAVETLRSAGDVEVLTFNPWLFSGTEQLVAHFFAEISAQLSHHHGKRFATAGTALATYGSAFSAGAAVPHLGAALAALGVGATVVGKVLQATGEERTPSLQEQRAQLWVALDKLPRRLLIIIDDIDRLRHDEIRDVMRLVKLTANFPRTVYLLAFDQARVERALSEGYGQTRRDGREYLDKILQVTFQVPTIQASELRALLAEGLAEVLTRCASGPFQQDDFTNVFQLVIVPLPATARDVRRYLNALPLTLDLLGAELALTDVVALEALRLFLPEVFVLLPELNDALAQTFRTGGMFTRSTVEDQAKQAAARVLEAAGDRGAVVEQFLKRVMPLSERFLPLGTNMWYDARSSQRWLRERRVAHPELFRLYLEKTVPSGALPAQAIVDLRDAFAHPAELALRLNALSSEQLVQALGRVEIYEDEFPTDDVAGALAVLMNQLSRLPTTYAPFGDLAPPLHLTRVVLRLLRRVPEESQCATAVEQALANVVSLIARTELVELVGFREGAGHKLVTEATAAAMEQRVAQEIVALSSEDLAREAGLARLLSWLVAAQGDAGRERLRTLLDYQPILEGLLQGALVEPSSLTLGDVAVRREPPRLQWGWLTDLCGEEELKHRVRCLAREVRRADLDERTAQALDLAVAYAEGGARAQEA